MTFSPPLDVPADLEAWMRTQSRSAFVGDMLRVLMRRGGLSQTQIDELRKLQRGDR